MDTEYDLIKVKKLEYALREKYVEIGKDGVVNIKYHSPKGAGDAHFCDIYYDNDNIQRVFDISNMIMEYWNIRENLQGTNQEENNTNK